jgi:hypothetical protein
LFVQVYRSLKLSEEPRLRMLENKVLRRMFGRKGRKQQETAEGS